MKHKFLLLYTWLIRTIMYFLPDHPFIMRLRGRLYGVFMGGCGSDFQVSSSVLLRTLENIYIGDNVYLAPGVIINSGTSIFIDNEVMVGFNSVIVASNHTLYDGSYRYGIGSTKTIRILHGSWIGANCTILAGAILPCSSVLGAGSVLKKEYDLSGVYVGCPAVCIRPNISL